MLVTLETSHDPIGPFLVHFPIGDSSRQALTAALSVILSCGAKAAVLVLVEVLAVVVVVVVVLVVVVVVGVLVIAVVVVMPMRELIW
jgi:hypothetical protein